MSSRTWKEAATSVPVLMPQASRDPKISSAGTRRAAQHPDDPVPRSVPPEKSGLPELEAGPLRASLEDLLRGSRGASGLRRRALASEPAPNRKRGVTVRGSLDRAKDVSPIRGAGGAARIGCVRLFSRTPTTFPSSASRGHPVVAGATARRGGDPLQTRRTGRGLRSDAAPRRATPSWRPGCLPPSRARACARISPGRPEPASFSRRPHVLHRMWRSAVGRALRDASERGRAPTDRDFGERAPLEPAVIVPFGSDSRTWD